MELTAGYKQTELGVIPEDWEVKRLGDISKIIMGHSPSSSYYNTNNLGVPLIQGNADIKNRKAIKRIFTSYVTKLAKAESILMSVRAPVGTISKTTFDACIGRGICAINFENNWIYHYLIHIEPNWYKHSQGSTFESINSSDILSLNINYPPTKTEQTAIAKVLTDVDDLLESLDKLIAKKRDIKQATMQQLLTGKTRLPSFANNQGNKQTELGIIPEDWEVRKLGGLVSFYKGSGLPKKVLTKNGSFSCIHYGELFTKYTEKIETTISKTNVNLSNNFFSKINDVLMPTSDVTPKGLAKASCILIDDAILGGDILVIRANIKQIDGIFLSYIIRYSENQILKLVTGTTVFHLYGSDMEKFKFLLPPTKTEQTAIAKVLTEIDDEIEALEQRRNKLTNLKQGMMQQLLTGKIRLIKPKQHKE